MDEKNTFYNRIYSIVIILGIILTVVSLFQTAEPTDDRNYRQIYPESVSYEGDMTRIFTIETKDFASSDQDIVFFTNHFFTEIYSDEGLIYENVYNGGIWGRTNGSRWHFISIPYGTDRIYVHLTAAYSLVSDQEIQFFTGDKLGIFKAIFFSSLPSAAISVLIIAFGIALIVYHIILNRKKHLSKSLLYLGVFSIIFGLWSANETNASVLFIPSRPAVSFIQYILLLLLCISCLLFMKEFIKIKDHLLLRILFTATLLLMIANITLQFLGIMDMKLLLPGTHGLIFCYLFFIAGTLIVRIIKKQVDRALKTNLIASVVLIISTSFDLFQYYNTDAISDSDVVGRLGFIAFICILANEAARTSLELIEKGQKAQIYEELAVIDMLTGFRNKNAYLTDVSEMHTFFDITVFTFDLNDLKLCNDTLGHSEGDAYIQSATRIIDTAFGRVGTCYRIGGDEFCVLIPNSSKVPVGELIYKFELAQRVHNESRNDGFTMHIAYGYATYTSELDKDINDTLKRADVIMYNNKRKQKDNSIR